MGAEVRRCSPSVLGLGQNGFGFLHTKKGGNRTEGRQKATNIEDTVFYHVSSSVRLCLWHSVLSSMNMSTLVNTMLTC